MNVALATVAVGDAYHRYADEMIASAEEFFWPSVNRRFVKMEGREGPWPNGTLYRHEILLARLPIATLVYLADADMRFEANCGSEIVPPDRYGIVATLHPGYVGRARAELPYETDPESACYLAPDEGSVYYAGGFLGGDIYSMGALLRATTKAIDADLARGHTPRFHDESALNMVLAKSPPALTLDPSMCHPDNAEWYRSVWPTDYPRVLVAIDKTAEERGDR